MPIYKLKCDTCGDVSQVICKTHEREGRVCTRMRGAGNKLCEGSLTPIITATSFSLKGQGWYRDGYR